MEPEKASGGDQDRKFEIRTEVAAGAAGIAAAAATLWLQLRNQFSAALLRTGVYSQATSVRDKAWKKLTADTPNFFEEHAKIADTYKAAKNAAHEKLGLTGVGSLKRRLSLLDKNNRLELIERTGGFGFMAATLVVGLGVVMKLSKKPEIKNQLDAKERSEGPVKA